MGVAHCALPTVSDQVGLAGSGRALARGLPAYPRPRNCPSRASHQGSRPWQVMIPFQVRRNPALSKSITLESVRISLIENKHPELEQFSLRGTPKKRNNSWFFLKKNHSSREFKVHTRGRIALNYGNFFFATFRFRSRLDACQQATEDHVQHRNEDQVQHRRQ